MQENELKCRLNIETKHKKYTYILQQIYNIYIFIQLFYKLWAIEFNKNN